MTLNRIDELLDARRDGTLDSAGQAELEQLLADDPAAGRRAAELDALSQALEEARDDQPPTGLAPQVMQRIARVPARRSVAQVIQWMPRSNSRGGRVMAKKVMFGVAAAAAIVLISVAITGFPKVNSTGTLGAISAAKRAQAPQINAADVKTDDPSVQQFLQSDTFDRLMKDPNTKKLLADPQYRVMLADTNIHAALINSDVRAAIADANVQAALANDAVKAAFADSAFVAAFSKADFRAALAKSDLKAALKESGLESAMWKADLAAAFAKDNVKAAFASTSLYAAMADANFAAAISKAGFRNMIADANIMAALNSSALSAAMQQSGFVAALNSSAMTAALVHQ
jgi:hypothetical protein